jgi:hypothetical protein
MDQLTRGTTNKSEKVRLLFNAGVSAADIGRYLGIRYQHTYNVLLRAGLIGRTAAKNAPAAPAAGDTILLELGPGGTVRLPAALLATHGLNEGDRLICRSGPDGLTIMSRSRARACPRRATCSKRFWAAPTGRVAPVRPPDRQGSFLTLQPPHLTEFPHGEYRQRSRAWRTRLSIRSRSSGGWSPASRPPNAIRVPIPTASSSRSPPRSSGSVF